MSTMETIEVSGDLRAKDGLYRLAMEAVQIHPSGVLILPSSWLNIIGAQDGPQQREHSVLCVVCRTRSTWHVDAVCEACRARGGAS